MLHCMSTTSVDQASGDIQIDDSLLSWGGNYAGLLASFDGTTGKLLPVPQHYVPKAFVEWGAIPTTLEVLSHESSSTTDGRTRMQTLVLPEVGCGVDNLETIIAVEDVVESNPDDAIGPNVQSSVPLLASATIMRKKSQQPNTSIYEAVFHHSVSEDEDCNYRCRVRVAVTEKEPIFCDHDDHGDDERSNRHVDGEIQVILERRVPNQEQTPNIADTKSGGLDGASVARWLGTRLNSEKLRSFGTINVAEASSNSDALALPLNITVASATEGPWWLEISKNSCGTVRFDSLLDT